MEIVKYGGWDRCARIAEGRFEMIVTLEVGPRIIRFGEIGGPNEFREYEKDRGKTGGDDYRSYGGHRLWIAPEERPKTYTPDNNPVDYQMDGDWHVFLAPTEKWLVQKEIRIRPNGDAFEIEHRIHNLGAYEIELAPWSITVMALGGECLFPQALYGAQPENLLPVRPLALWPYTNMADSRWTWGRRIVRLRQTDDKEPQKIGAFVSQGIAAYPNHGNVFVKQFPADPKGRHVDFGCNFETFTRDDMLEIESVGPVVKVEPAHYASHREMHRLLLRTTPPSDEQACWDFLLGLA